ncbi:MAG: galactokinase [Desulfitobacteriaceae bacterium]
MSGLSTLRQKFEQVFGWSSRSVRVFFAPGRVNLIGEHTDFTGGYVFPAALTYGTWAVVRARQDGRFSLASTSFDKRVEFNENEIEYRQEDDWANYPKGVISEFLKLGVHLSGCDILFHGNIPNGAGLSSSASLELVTGMALRVIEDINLSILDLVKLAQRAENQFVGVNCGIMDQFAVGMGKAGQAILLKCDKLEYRYVPLSLGDYLLVITNSNKQRSLTESKYNQRWSECETGFKILQQHLPSVSCLGDVSLKEWEKVRLSIDSKEIYKRLEHVVNENARALASTRALEAGELNIFGQYMMESHESLRDLFEVTGMELDTLFAEARQVEGCIGTRMTGAGFGGCTVSLVHKNAVQDFQARVSQGYRAKTGLRPTFYSCDIGDGAREVTEEVEGCLF